MCGDDSRDGAGIPIDQIEQAIQPNETQRAALDDLANASIQAARTDPLCMPDACRHDVIGQARGHAAARRGDDFRNGIGAAGLGEILWPAG